MDGWMYETRVLKTRPRKLTVENAGKSSAAPRQ